MPLQVKVVFGSIRAKKLNRRDGVVVRTSTSKSVDLRFIPLVTSYQKTLKMVFTTFLLGARHLGKVAKSKLASSLVVSLGKALNGTPPPLCGRQVAQFYLRKEGWWQEEHPTVK